MNKPIKVEFAPGAFDNFEGTQEELDELIAEIQEMANSGELFEKSKRVNLEDLIEEDPEFAEAVLRHIDDNPESNRKLQ